MPMTKRLLTELVDLSAVAVLTVASASAQTLDKRVYYTFSGQVEIPGAVLPAGQYMFHLADPTSSRQVIQVQSADGKKVYGMFFSMPITRPDAPDEPEVRFMEAASGTPPAIGSIWYIGEKTGRELIYPKEQALRIARATNQPVLTTMTATNKAEDAKSGELTRVSPSGRDTQIAENTTPAAPAGRSMRGSDQAPGSETTAGTSGQAPAPRRTGDQASARARLPETATSVPSMWLFGLGLIAAAAGLRLWRTACI